MRPGQLADKAARAAIGVGKGDVIIVAVEVRIHGALRLLLLGALPSALSLISPGLWLSLALLVLAITGKLDFTAAANQFHTGTSVCLVELLDMQVSAREKTCFPLVR